MPKKSSQKNVTHHKHAPHGPHHILFYIILFVVVFGVTYTIFSNFNWAGSAETPMMQSTVQGTYTGVTPCADCPGIDTTLTLNENAYGNPTTYSLSLVYQERDSSFTETGAWTLSTWKNKPLITLVPKESAQVTYYEVLSNNQIRQLDGDRNPIPESIPFTLTKE